MRVSRVLLVGSAALLGCSYDASRLRAPSRPDSAIETGGGGGPDSPVAADLSRDEVELPDVGENDVIDAPANQAPALDAPVNRPDDGAEVGAGLETGGDELDEDGAAGEDGTNPTGGNTGSGGASNTDAPMASGGVPGSGGRSGTGGVPASGGQSGSGGTADAATTTPTTVVTFLNGSAQGAMTGYGAVSLGVLDTVSTPTCGGQAIPGLPPASPALSFTSSCAAANTTWNSSTALCVSGSVPAWPPNPTAADYDNDWGVLIGVNALEPPQGIGVSYKTMTFTTTGTPNSGLRAVIHRHGDADNLTYCANLTTGAPITLTTFNTQCWDNSGTYFKGPETAKIDLVGLHVPSTSTAVRLTNLCLTKIVLGK